MRSLTMSNNDDILRFSHKGEGVQKRAKIVVILKESPKASGMKEYLSLR